MLLSNLLESMRVLGGSADVNLIVVNLNLETRGQEGVETNDEVWVSLEEVGDTADYTWRVNAFTEWVERGREKEGESQDTNLCLCITSNKATGYIQQLSIALHVLVTSVI